VCVCVWRVHVCGVCVHEKGIEAQTACVGARVLRLYDCVRAMIKERVCAHISACAACASRLCDTQRNLLAQPTPYSHWQPPERGALARRLLTLRRGAAGESEKRLPRERAQPPERSPCSASPLYVTESKLPAQNARDFLAEFDGWTPRQCQCSVRPCASVGRDSLREGPFSKDLFP
jgi:hypothetical protein